MTDKDKIKFAIRYLKKGLKSKQTPPLYEELMKELGFVSEKELGKVEGKLADLTSEYYELENLKNNEIAELKEKWLQATDEGTSWAHLKSLERENTEVREELTEAKDLIRNLLRVTYGEGWNYSLDWKVKAEQFLKE